MLTIIKKTRKVNKKFTVLLLEIVFNP